MRRPTLSLVLPLHDEAGELKDLETHLSSWLSAYEIECEIVLVDDGSADDTRLRSEAWAARDPRVVVVPLLHRYGVEGALRAGLDRASGEAIVLVDGDVQDSAEVIPRLIEQWRGGADLVHARRRPTQVERGAKSWVRRSIHELTDSLTRNGVPQDAGNFRLVDHAVATRLKALTDSARNLRGLLAHVAHAQRSVSFESVPSRRRKSPSVVAEFDSALDSITRRSLVPLRLAYVVAAISFGGGLLALLLMFLVALVSHTPIRSWLWISAILGIVSGIQLFFVGVAGEYLGRLFLDQQKLPPYTLAGALPARPAVATEAAAPADFAPIPAPASVAAAAAAAPIPVPDATDLRSQAVSLNDAELEAAPPSAPAIPVRASTPPPPRMTPPPGQVRAVTTKNTVKLEAQKTEAKPGSRPSNPPLPSKRASFPPPALASKPELDSTKSAPPPSVASDRPPPSFMTNAGPSSVGARTKTLAGIPLPAMLAYGEGKSDAGPASKRDLSPRESSQGTGDDDATKVGVVPADIERLKEEPKVLGTLHGVPSTEKP